MRNLDDLLAAADSYLHELPDGPRKDNAIFCIREATAGAHAGNGSLAYYWAVRSLKHSIGILHPAYQRAITLST